MDKNLSYEFGAYRFEPSQARLVCGDQVIRLTTKASDTLLALVERPDVVVSKDDIINAVWPGLAVEENNLNQQISAVRKALSNNGHTVTIETVPRKGYRLVGPVRRIDPARRRRHQRLRRRRALSKPTPATTNAATLLPHPAVGRLPRRLRRAVAGVRHGTRSRSPSREASRGTGISGARFARRARRRWIEGWNSCGSGTMPALPPNCKRPSDWTRATRERIQALRMP